jgi:hypothetical protein
MWGVKFPGKLHSTIRATTYMTDISNQQPAAIWNIVNSISLSIGLPMLIDKDIFRTMFQVADRRLPIAEVALLDAMKLPSRVRYTTGSL